MRKMTDAGIVLADADAQHQWYSLNTDLLRETRRAPLSRSRSHTVNALDEGKPAEEERFRAKVLRDFFEEGRLKGIPAQRKRRVIVLQHL